MAKIVTALVLMCTTLVAGQRPFFAGSRPIGYPDLASTTPLDLGDRFGEVDGTTQRLPIEANGDRDLVDRLSKLPIDNQPFWLINWQALEKHRENPQTYPQRPNQFIDTPPNSGSSLNPTNANSNVNNNSNSVNHTVSSNSGSSNSPNTTSGSSGIGNSNRFSAEEYPILDKRNPFSEKPTNSGSTINSGNANSNSGKVHSNSGIANSNSGKVNSISGNANSDSVVNTSDVGKKPIENVAYYPRPAYYL